MSEDVSKFLMQVRELGDRRVEEDEARSRELEEKILQDRKERQARRAERARSISPQKSSPANTPPPSAQRAAAQAPERLALDSSPILEPPASPQLGGLPQSDSMNSSPTKENESPFESDNKRASGSMSPTRTGSMARGLSWQQRRPTSISRPLSMVAAENAARSSNSSTEPTEPASRDQISQALSSKDPAWFRQTADRGISSDAYRKEQVEDEERTDMSSTKTQLPGMARGPTAEPTKGESNSRPESPGLNQGLASPIVFTKSQKLDPPNGDTHSAPDATQERQHLVSSPLLGRTSPTRTDRPVSPTKGMGGFVQSAMMKRSDSVNKRWSVHSSTGLQRGDSVASSHGTYDAPNRKSMSAKSRPTSLFRETSLETSSQPSSSQGKEGRYDIEPISPSTVDTSLKLDTKTPSPPEPREPDAEKATPPSSPSKTMDQRRWSPNKASWLESALNKPESPKPKQTPPSNQPAWMAELAKARAQKASSNSSTDLGRAPTVSHKHQVSIGGLARTSTPSVIAKPSALGGLPGSVTPSTGGTRPGFGSVRKNSQVSAGEDGDDKESPTSANPKPDTPPTKDFRANLKPRHVPSASGSTNNNELKSVFGTLRKTTTQNYVAPDELKSNILRGKAGLNLTGGPQKTERKDEFKEAILAKKKEFQKVQVEGKGVARTASDASETPLPEGLAKKMELGRSGTLRRDSATSDVSSVIDLSKRSSVVSKHDSTSQATPTLFDRPMSLERRGSMPPRSPVEPRRPSSGPKRGSAQEVPIVKPKQNAAPTPGLHKETSVPGRLQPKVGGTLANRFNPALAGLLARGPPTSSSAPSSDTDSPVPPSTSSDGGDGSEAASVPKLTHMTKNRARGPRRKAPTSTGAGASSPSKDLQDAVNTTPSASKPASSSLSSLQKEDVPVTTSRPQVASLVGSSMKGYGSSSRPGPEAISIVDSSKKAFEPTASDLPAKSSSPSRMHSRSPSKIHEQVAAFATLKSSPSPTKIREEVVLEKSQPASPSRGHSRSPSKIHDQVAAFSAFRSPTSPTKTRDEPEQRSQPPSPRKLDMKRMSKFFDESNQISESVVEREPPKNAVKSPSPDFEKTKVRSPPLSASGKASPSFSKPTGLGTKGPEVWSPPPTSSGRPSPSLEGQTRKEPAWSDKVDSASSVSVAGGSSMFGGKALPAIPPTGDLTHPKSASKPLPSEPKSASKPLPSEPKSVPKPLPSPGPKSPLSMASPMRSPTKQATEVSSVLNEFFGPNRPKREYRVDAAELLMNRPATSASRIQTLSAQLFQFSADGKKLPVPAQGERVLYEREMYLCSHTFKDAAGKKTSEVYFWAGDDVSSSIVEDASTFVTREARALGGKLVKLRQGKETPEFVAALGGIIITRRGTSNKFDSLAPHMLCGRRYLGQVAFDEVDCSSAALCSGFPYLITNAGRCYLWKGKGSGVDELSCARLIGMDYALSGEMEEIEDGREPANFWDLFKDGGPKFSSADHWRLKPNYDKYCSRLFCSSAASKQQILELSPFSQADLHPTKIYVLDAFFELYIIVGSRAQLQYASFHNALDFAQEYAILAAGMEDRPFVPISTVVLEGIPRDMKRVFRKWRDADSPTITNTPGSGTGLRRGRSLRIVPLNQALQALSD
ncbi:uncharacterized protein BCR38DRAFT_419400 [Pseudomassariella vexata]|uniref:DUF4045 domain-containing protein n=1 Tax=Pseudomassariella vexata TaxID=1141098 RepID=A0A1Y2EDA8_9PEZI|nr:uncharacterized protein BCR38DRAFT_419400 [Pseudomassariella vexata]ORY69542.1 hypothetical protein BCR38DRAFT_419400 [Pseudomassariella vexata]